MKTKWLRWGDKIIILNGVDPISYIDLTTNKLYKYEENSMKIILTDEDVKRVVVARLVSMGQLFGDVDYEVTISSYDKDFMTIQAPELKKDGDK